MLTLQNQGEASPLDERSRSKFQREVNITNCERNVQPLNGFTYL